MQYYSRTVNERVDQNGKFSGQIVVTRWNQGDEEPTIEKVSYIEPFYLKMPQKPSIPSNDVISSIRNSPISLVFFSGSFCGPCKQLKKELSVNPYKNLLKKINYIVLDLANTADQKIGKDILTAFGIEEFKTVPKLALFRNGDFDGLVTKEDLMNL